MEDNWIRAFGQKGYEDEPVKQDLIIRNFANGIRGWYKIGWKKDGNIVGWYKRGEWAPCAEIINGREAALSKINEIILNWPKIQGK
jgi:hypothetical protein